MSGELGSSVHAAHAAALLQLAKSVGAGDATLDENLRLITEAAATALALDRCGVWMYDAQRRAIVCADLFERSPDRHSRGQRLTAADHPDYFAALAEDRVIAAHDAVRDPRTRGFTEEYLHPLGIASMLDAPVWLDGEVAGIVCHEHLGVPRHFSAADESFAGAAADLVALAYEIDRRSRTEQELRLSESHLRMLSEVAQELVFDVDAEGCVAYASPNVTRVLGRTPAELVGRPLLELLHPEDAGDCERRLREALAGGASLTTMARQRVADGSWHSFECSVSPLDTDDGPRRLVVVSRDVTERLAAEQEARDLQARLGRTQRLEALGRLAGGIAHDFNNMLTVISSSAHELMLRLPQDGESYEDALQISEAAARSASLSRQLLAFGRRELLQPRTLDLAQVVGGVERMLKRLVGPGVDLRLGPFAPQAWVLADQGQLEQVLVNLVLNARDAMPDGGPIEVRVALQSAGRAPEHLFGQLPDPECVVLSVRDHGTGIDPAVRERLFDPFFTTKPPGQGTGLGLSTVWGVVQQLGGAIGLSAGRPGGSCFEVFLPRHVQAQPDSDPPRGAVPWPPHRARRILLVEDERLVRELVHGCLTEAGHEVLVAESPEQALQEVEQAAPLDLLVSDVVMPGMDGVSLWRRLRASHAELPVLLMSGFPDGARTGAAELPPGACFLAKPFRPDELLAAVDAALGQRA